MTALLLLFFFRNVYFFGHSCIRVLCTLIISVLSVFVDISFMFYTRKGIYFLRFFFSLVYLLLSDDVYANLN